MSNFTPEIHHQEDVEYGLRLPNGTIIWPPDTFHDHSLVTAESRATIIEVLKAAAVNLGKAPEELLGEYAWMVRYRRTTVVVDWAGGFDVPMSDPQVVYVPKVMTPVNTEEVPVADDESPSPEETGGRHSV